MASNSPVGKVFLHVSDSPDTKDIGAAKIDEWHKQRGWTGIGYHYVIRRSGAVEKGRDETEIGAHVFGHNKHSLGVVWVGRDKPAEEQYKTMVELVSCLLVKHGLTEKECYGHREFDPGKTCPNVDMDKFRAAVAEQLAKKTMGLDRSGCNRVGGACACALARPPAGPRRG